MDVAAEIRAERARKNWTQDELAEASGVSVPTIARAERGDRCTADVLVALLVALGRGDLSIADVIEATPRAVGGGR